MRYGKRTSPIHYVRPGRTDCPLAWAYLPDHDVFEILETRWMTAEELEDYMLWELAWSVEAIRLSKAAA